MAQQQKNNRKFGRNKDRPSAKAYLATGRQAVNKAKKIAKHKKAQAKKRTRPPAEKGAARNKRRATLQLIWKNAHETGEVGSVSAGS